MHSKLKLIHLRRSLAFQDMSLVELSMNRLISLYFLNTASDKKFISQMLQHQYFSFELRRRIFKMIFDDKYPDKKFPWKVLEKMQNLRNIIAHSRIDEIFKDGEKEFYYCYHDEKYVCIILHDEFKECMDKIVHILNEISEDTMIKYNPELPINI